MTDKKQLAVTKVGEYKKHSQQMLEEGVPVELPSGYVFRCKRPQLSTLLKNDAIPSHLTNVAVKMMSNQLQMTSVKDLKQSMELVDKIVLLSVVEPQVSEDGAGDTLALKDITDDDKIAIFTFVQGGEGALDSFRKQSVSR